MPVRDRDVVAAYRERYPCCQLAGWWQQIAIEPCHGLTGRECDTCRDYTSGSWLDCPQVHHIVGGPFRYDLACNLVTCCGYAHAWIHEADPIAGKIVCWRVKRSVGEFDPSAISAFWHRDVGGWLQMQTVVDRCRKSERLDQWRRELIEFCEGVR